MSSGEPHGSVGPDVVVNSRDDVAGGGWSSLESPAVDLVESYR